MCRSSWKAPSPESPAGTSPTPPLAGGRVPSHPPGFVSSPLTTLHLPLQFQVPP